jgi:hypothetical protein
MNHFITRNGTHLIPLDEFRIFPDSTPTYLARMDEDYLFIRPGENLPHCLIVRDDGFLLECSASAAQDPAALHTELTGSVHRSHMPYHPEKVIAAIQATPHDHPVAG